MFTIHTRDNCSFCTDAKDLLNRFSLLFTEIEYKTEEQISEFKSAGFKTFPQVFDGTRYVGGYTDLEFHILNEYV